MGSLPDDFRENRAMLDGFLELFDENGKPIKGESTDSLYLGQIQISDFGLGDPAGAATDEEEGEDAKGKGKTPAGKAPPVDERLAGMLPKKGPPDLLTKAKKTAWGEEEKGKDGEAKKKKGEELGFRVTKEIDTASPDLFLAFCRSQVHKPPKDDADKKIGQYQKAVVRLRKMFVGGGHDAMAPTPYLVCTFEQVQIVSYSLKASEDDPHPKETIQFKFAGYQVEYTAQTAEGQKGKPRPPVKGTLAGNKSTDG